MPFQLTRSEPIQFARWDGTLILASACTRGQMREVFDLDRQAEETEDPALPATRRGAQVAVFLRDARWMQADGTTPAGNLSALLESLTPDEEVDIIHAFTAQHHGIRPENAVAIQQALRDELKKKIQA